MAFVREPARGWLLKRGGSTGTAQARRERRPSASQTRQTRMDRGGGSRPSATNEATRRGASETKESATGVASNETTALGSAAVTQQDAHALQDPLPILPATCALVAGPCPLASAA